MATEAAEAQPSTSAAADKYVEFHVCYSVSRNKMKDMFNMMNFVMTESSQQDTLTFSGQSVLASKTLIM